MSNKIPGVPDGWELVAIRKPIKGDWLIAGNGLPEEYQHGSPSRFCFPVVRKIEKPARYRPFANAEEYLPHWGRPIRTMGDAGFDSVASTSEYTVYVNSGNGKARYTMAEAFEQLRFADGTPFGVRIDE